MQPAKRLEFEHTTRLHHAINTFERQLRAFPEARSGLASVDQDDHVRVSDVRSVQADLRGPGDVGSLGLTRWEGITLDLVLILLSWAFVSLLLALTGLMHWWLVLPGSVACWLGARTFMPRTKGSSRGPRRDGWCMAAVTIAAALVVFNAWFPAERLLTGRDAGTHMATAGWLAETGRLSIDARVDPFDEFPELRFAVPGFYERVGTDSLEPQFMHAYPAMVGSLIDAAGLGVSLRLNAVVGGILLLAVFALSRRLMRPLAALLALGAMGASLVFVYYARAPFTEMLMAVFAVSGAWMLVIADDAKEGRSAIIGGVLAGAATLVRLDGIVLLVPVMAYLVVRERTRPDLALSLRRARSAMLVVALIGLAESLMVSPLYVLDRATQVGPVLLAVFAILVLDRLEPVVQRLISLCRDHRSMLFKIVLGVASVMLIYAWAVRPLVVEAGGASYGLQPIQEQEGLQHDPTRSYSEQSVSWIVWYQGAFFVLLGFVGAMLLLRASLFEKGRARNALLVLILLAFSTLYFWRPSINPDHIWVMRRYLTVVLPFGAIAAAYAVDRVTSALSSRSRWLSHVGAAALGAALLVPPIVTTSAAWDIREFEGLADDFESVCDQIGPSSHVLLVGEAAGIYLAQGLRSYCGIPTAFVAEDLPESRLEDLEEAVADRGSRLLVLGSAYKPRLFPDTYTVLAPSLSKPPRERAEVTLEVGVRD